MVVVHEHFMIYTKIFLFHQAAEQIKKLYNLFIKVDATQVEINPFGETPDGRGEVMSCLHIG